MKKKYVLAVIIVAVIMVVIFTVVAVSKLNSDRNNNVISVETEENPDFLLTVNNATSTGAEVEIVWKDEGTHQEALTGDAFGIEKYVNNTWEACEYVDKSKDRVWLLIGYLIPYKETIDWEWLYGELSPGKYRICKGVTIKNSTGNENRALYEEFEIN